MIVCAICFGQEEFFLFRFRGGSALLLLSQFGQTFAFPQQQMELFEVRSKNAFSIAVLQRFAGLIRYHDHGSQKKSPKMKEAKKGSDALFSETGGDAHGERCVR